MIKRIRLAFFVMLALSAFFLLPGVSFAASREATVSQNTTTANLAFTGLITQGAGKGIALTGGLTIGIRSNGYFNGNFHLPDGTQISVSGRIKSDGNLNITFYTANGKPYITGQGKPKQAGEYVGPFQVFSGKSQVAWGIWSAVAVANPSSSLALAFDGQTVKGPATGTNYSGAIVLDSKTLKGTLNLPNGAIVDVQAAVKGDDITVVFDLGGGAQIIGYGEATKNPANGLNTGFKGPFYGPGNGDVGKWTAFFFGF